jgi:DNA polymerase-3 subunit gamma/tau
MNESILYQKYRPQNFSQVVGQDSIVKILKNEVLTNSITNAYIFFGPRGTGKTSLARIFSKAINCNSILKNGDPCNKCDNCKEITDGNFLDLIEIDAASNRGIEDIRDIKNRIQFVPSSGHYKIYIIDEVHMLTSDAFNALLKTLEEPPNNVIFILATTEIYKVPQTIISRCQRFDFIRPSYYDLSKYLNSVLNSEKINLGENTKDLLITVADGSFRDLMTSLQKILSVNSGKIEYSDVLTLLNYPDLEFIKLIWAHLIDSDIEYILDSFKSNNISISIFIKNSIDYIRKTLINRVLQKNYYDIDDSIFKNISIKDLLKIINKLIDSIEDLKVSSLDQIVLEVTLISIINDLSANKNKVKSKNVENKVNMKKSVTINDSQQGNFDNELWMNLINITKEFNHHMSGFLTKSNFYIEGNKFIIVVPFSFYKDMLNETKEKKYLSQKIKEIYGDNFDIDCIVEKNVIPVIKNNHDFIEDSDLKEVFDLEV